MTFGITWFGDVVDNVARAIFTIFEVNLSFAGSFHRNGERSGSSLTGPDIELAWLSLLTTFQTWTTSMDPVGSTITERSYSELERRAGDVNVVILNGHG